MIGRNVVRGGGGGLRGKKVLTFFDFLPSIEYAGFFSIVGSVAPFPMVGFTQYAAGPGLLTAVDVYSSIFLSMTNVFAVFTNG